MKKTAKKRARRKSGKKAARERPAAAPAETRLAEALTVAWMLTLLATLLAELALIFLAVTTGWRTEAQGLLPLPGLMLLIATVTGSLCLLLTPLAMRYRASPPPPGIAWAAVLAGAAPFLLWAGLSWS